MLGLILIACFMVLLCGAALGLYRWNQERHPQWLAKIDNHFQKRQPAVKRLRKGTPDAQERGLMPERTKQELLKKLERFESSLQFTEKNISIAVLAGKMRTNTKYLSYIINNCRHKDFNTYINELRINYIIAKMENDERYLSYKISYLAEECGFTTHSQFTTVFKSFTGMSPSTFLARLKEECHC